MVQVVESLPNKLEATSSNPSTTQKPKKEPSRGLYHVLLTHYEGLPVPPGSSSQEEGDSCLLTTFSSISAAFHGQSVNDGVGSHLWHL
jgi:hypothetical protein